MDEDSSEQISNVQAAPQPKRSRAAEYSLLLGIFSNFALWLLGSIPAIILGGIAIRNINRSPSTLSGKGMAIAGIITACTGVLVCPVFILGSGLFHHHPDSNRAKCILQMSSIEKTIISHGNMNEIEPGQPIPVEVIVDEGYMEKLPTCPEGGIYTFTGKMPSGDAGSEPYTKCSIKNHDFDPWKDMGVDAQQKRSSDY